MIKYVAIVWRKPSLTHEQFLAHWCGEHARLLTRHAPALGIERYVQVRRTPSAMLDGALRDRGWLPPPDGLAEAYWASRETMEAALASPAGMAANVELAADEALFCDMSRMSAFLAGESVVVGRQVDML